MSDTLFHSGDVTVDGNSTPFVPVYPSLSSCNYFINNQNQTVIFEFSNPYGGIPQNLAFNLMGWLFLLLLFTFLRRAAGNYGRLALVRKDEYDTSWTQIFFGGDETLTAGIQTIDPAEVEPDQQRAEEGLDSIDFTSEVPDRNCLSWIWGIFTLTDEQFRRKSGEDAVQYLRFQRHLMVFVSLITVFSIAVVLPVNFQGDQQGSEVDFGHTTISNLRGEDERLWVHVLIAILLFPIGVVFMRRFSVGLKITLQEHGDGSNDKSVESRSLMILSVPKEFCDVSMLTQHFAEIYPYDAIVEISVAFDVSKLTELDFAREKARRARIYCENWQSRHGSGQQMIPQACGILCMPCNTRCGSCSCCQTVDALTFYRKEEEQIALKEVEEKRSIVTKSIGIAFVTFKKLESAQKVVRDHNWNCCRLFSQPPRSSLSNLLKPRKWSVRYAPPPEDIYWENITNSHTLYVLKAVAVNIFVFLMLFFFTSPPIILSQMDVFLHLKSIGQSMSLPEKINDFVPTLMLWSLSALLPLVVASTDWWLGHWRRSVENLWIMRKVFIFLLFMVIILPSVGLTSLRGFIEAIVTTANVTNGTSNYTFQWSCIFLPDNGAFFVNYVITSAMIGTALELMRISELIVYAVRMCLARSTAETPSVRRATLYEYPFGFNYGWMLLIFALTATYCVVSPLITPFGLFYLVMKHLVDRYNIYYAYKPSKINKNIHAAAVNFVIFSLLLQQFVLLSFIVLRSPKNDEGARVFSLRVFVSILFIVLFGLVLVGSFFWQFFNGISPIQYHLGSGNASDSDSLQDQEETFEVTGPTPGGNRASTLNRYIPNVLKKSVSKTLPASSAARRDISDEENLNTSSRRVYGAISGE